MEAVVRLSNSWQNLTGIEGEILVEDTQCLGWQVLSGSKIANSFYRCT